MASHSSILAVRVFLPMNSMQRQKDMTPEDEPPTFKGVQYATGEEQRNSSRKNEAAEPKWK